jgi:hypothetical protein
MVYRTEALQRLSLSFREFAKQATQPRASQTVLQPMFRNASEGE